MVFDNSRLNQPPSHCLTFAKGRLVFALPRLPDWSERLMRLMKSTLRSKKKCKSWPASRPSIFNARIGIDPLDGPWEASVYTNNMFDKQGATDLPVAISADLPTTRRVALN